TPSPRPGNLRQSPSSSAKSCSMNRTAGRNTPRPPATGPGRTWKPTRRWASTRAGASAPTSWPNWSGRFERQRTREADMTMQAIETGVTTEPGKSARIAGWTLSGLLIAFLAMDGAIKLVPLQVVLDTSAQLGLPTDVTSARILGLLTLLCTILYAIPRTAVLGAILMTGYLGGAMATHY